MDTEALFRVIERGRYNTIWTLAKNG